MSDKEYRVDILYEAAGSEDLEDSNVDVIVSFEGRATYAATFFTLRNIESLMDRYRMSGECANGLYLWSTNMIIVERVDRETIEHAIADLLKSGEFAAAFSAR